MRLSIFSLIKIEAYHLQDEMSATRAMPFGYVNLVRGLIGPKLLYGQQTRLFCRQEHRPV